MGFGSPNCRRPRHWVAHSRIDGSPLIYNERDTWLPDLVVCQPHLAEKVLAALREGRLDA